MEWTPFASWKWIAAGVCSQRVTQQAAFQRIDTRHDEGSRRFIIETRLLVGPEHLMLFQRLQSKIGPVFMALNTSDIVVSLGQENWLNFVLEIFEIQCVIGSVRRSRWRQNKNQSE